MRKHFTLACIATFVIICSSHAQVVNKGDKLFGGSFSFSVFNTNDNGPAYYNTGNVGLLPSFGWAIKKNLVLGIRGSIGYSRSKASYNFSDHRIITSLNFGPGVYLRKYRELKNKFGVYFNHEASVQYNRTKEKIGSVAVGNFKTWGGSYTFSPGVFYKFSDHFFGEANIGGLYASYYSGNNSNNYGAGVSFLQYFNLGINYRFRGKKS